MKFVYYESESVVFGKEKSNSIRMSQHIHYSFDVIYLV